jgi:phage terminase large subunit-like protein
LLPHDYGRKVVQGLIEDDSFMFVDYGIDEGDDPFSEETWKKANPNYGISIEPETFRRTARQWQSPRLHKGRAFYGRAIHR